MDLGENEYNPSPLEKTKKGKEKQLSKINQCFQYVLEESNQPTMK